MPHHGFDFKKKREWPAFGSRREWPPLNPEQQDPNAISNINITTNTTVTGTDEFTKGLVIYLPTAALDVVGWITPITCSVSQVQARRNGGTAATVQVRKNASSNILVSTLSLGTADTWTDGGSVQNTSFTSGDFLEFRLLSFTGNVIYVVIQVT